MVCQNAFVGDYPCHFVGGGRLGVGVLAVAPNACAGQLRQRCSRWGTATVLLAVAVLWPLLERPIIQALRA